jgi:DNA uptake protein and related DNA-binding proteins
MQVLKEMEVSDTNKAVKQHLQSKQPLVKLYPFDPNTIDSAGWLALGISHRSIRTIRNYVRKGGRFRKPEDLARIYGFRQEDYKRLLPYIKIAYDTIKPHYQTKRPPKAAPAFININTADTTTFIALPGIGSKLANRIITFRDKLGGFYSVEQIAETYGLPDSTFRLIQPRLQCTANQIRKININTADINTLKQHPYIKWPVANAIVQFRQQHGAYRKVEELKQIVILPADLYKKIRPYLSTE